MILVRGSPYFFDHGMPTKALRHTLASFLADKLSYLVDHCFLPYLAILDTIPRFHGDAGYGVTLETNARH